MRNAFIIMADVDEVEYEVEFDVIFNETHVLDAEILTVHRIDHLVEDDTKFVKIDLKADQELLKAIKKIVWDHATNNTTLEEPEKEYDDEEWHY